MHLNHPFITSAVSVVKQELKVKTSPWLLVPGRWLHLGSKTLERVNLALFKGGIKGLAL